MDLVIHLVVVIIDPAQVIGPTDGKEVVKETFEEGWSLGPLIALGGAVRPATAEEK